MIKTSDILDEKNKHLRAKNIDVEFPLSKETKKSKRKAGKNHKIK